MARKKTTPQAEQTRAHLAARLKEIRAELFGEKGAPELARSLGVPARTWYNYERGVTVPADVLLRFIELTGAEPAWLLHGRGERYRPAPAARGGGPPTDGPPTGDEPAAVALARQLSRCLEGGRLEVEVTWKVTGDGR